MKRYYYNSQISEHIKETPEGYLLCLDVPIARTGVLEYLPEEVDMEAPEGFSVLQVWRMDADFFTPETMASFEGKPVTLDHPEAFVTPDNWAGLAKGLAQNIRRGEGEDRDLLLADLLITDAEAISCVRSGLREISCGYDADYQELKPGTGRQLGIIGNHIALVEHGRCGPRCQIKDRNMKEKNRGFFDRLIANIRRRAKDAAGEENGETLVLLTESEVAQLAQADPSEVPQNLADSLTEEPVRDEGPGSGLESKMDEVLILLRKLAAGGSADSEPDPAAAGENPAQTGDEDPEKAGQAEETPPRKAADRKPGTKKTADAETVRRARLIAPEQWFGIGDSAEAVARVALRDARKIPVLKRVIDSCLAGTGLEAASGGSLAAALTAASEMAAVLNNSETAAGLLYAKRKTADSANQPTTPADLNRISQEYRDSLNGGKKP